jgi:hypothetical protein
MLRADPEMREYHYVVDHNGRILHDGTEIVDGPTLRFFLRAMTHTPDSRWLVVCQGEQNWFETRDTPFIVQRVRLTSGPDGLQDVELCFAGDSHEPLDPTTLESQAGMVFCRIRRGAFRARFGRLAMQQLAPHLSEEGGAPVLRVDGRSYPIANAP